MVMNQVNARRSNCICSKLRVALFLVIGVLIALNSGCQKDEIGEASKVPPVLQKSEDEPLSPQQLKIEAIADSENLLQALSPQMKAIVRSLSDSEIDVSGFVRVRITHV